MGYLRYIVQFLAVTSYFYALSVSKDTTIVVLLTYILPLIIVALLSRFYLKQKMNNGMIGSIAYYNLRINGFWLLQRGLIIYIFLLLGN